MFVTITSSGGRQYVKLVEAFRDDAGVPRQPVIATLGRIESVRAGESNALINGLLRAADQPTMDEGTGSVATAKSMSTMPGFRGIIGRRTGKSEPSSTAIRPIRTKAIGG